MNNYPAVYMSQEQINALFSHRDSTLQRDGRINSLNMDTGVHFKTESVECEDRPTNQSENMMMITREEYMGLQQEYERRKDMEDKYKEDINQLMRTLHQVQQDLKDSKTEVDQLKQANLRKDQSNQSLRLSVQESAGKEQQAVLELANFYEEHAQLKQKFEILTNKYNNLSQQHKFEVERKDKQIDQLKTQIISISDEYEKTKKNETLSQSQSQLHFKSSILFQKDKPIQVINAKSNYDSKMMFAKKAQI